jgi:hypothetical protein
MSERRDEAYYAPLPLSMRRSNGPGLRFFVLLTERSLAMLFGQEERLEKSRRRRFRIVWAGLTAQGSETTSYPL